MDQIQSINELTKIIHSFADGGWLVLIVGLAGMMARLALVTGKVTILQCIKNLIAAMICSSITWFILEEIKMHFMYKAIIYTLAGLDAPELIQGSLKIAHGFAQDPHSFLVQLRKGKIYDNRKHGSQNNKTSRPTNRKRNK